MANITWNWLKKMLGVEHLSNKDAEKAIIENRLNPKPNVTYTQMSVEDLEKLGQTFASLPKDDFDAMIEKVKKDKEHDKDFDLALFEKRVKMLRDGFTRNQAHTSSLITESKNNLTREQLKIFYQCVTLIDPIQDKNFGYYTISVKDFCEKLGFTQNNRWWLVNELRKMLRQVFEIETTSGDYIGYTIFSSLRYRNAEQQIDIRFNNDMMPFLLELQKRFTKIEQTKYIISFNSKYAIRFYVFLKDYRLMSHRDFTIEALEKQLELPKSYTSSYARFYQKVLKPAIDDINQHSDLWVKEPKIIQRQGKKVIKFRLEFGNKATQLSEDFCLLLQKKFKQYNDFYLFYGQWWLDKTIMNEPVRIKEISANNGNYYELFCENIANCAYQTPNKQEFINKIINGIYCGIEWKYENEKQSLVSVTEWQNNKDKLKAFRNYFNAVQKQARIGN